MALQQAGASVTIVDAYRTVLPDASSSLVNEIFGAATVVEGSGTGRRVDALTFTSSSTVRNLLALLERSGIAWPRQAQVFSIGPITSGTLREHGIEPDAEAYRHDVEGLVAVVVQGFAG